MTLYDEDLDRMAADPHLVTDDEVRSLIREIRDLKQHRLVEGMKDDKRYIRQLEDALDFYADPENYFAIAFMADPPCGAFADDFEDIEDIGFKPGKRARQVLDYGYNVVEHPKSGEEDLQVAEQVLVRGTGALPPPDHAWEQGLTVASIDFVREVMDFVERVDAGKEDMHLDVVNTCVAAAQLLKDRVISLTDTVTLHEFMSLGTFPQSKVSSLP